MSWQCPHCNGEISRLLYSTDISGTEVGTAYLEPLPDETMLEEKDDVITDYESEDRETSWDNNITYSCPLCDGEIETEELVWTGEGEEITEKPTPEKEPNELRFNITKPEINIIEDKDINTMQSTIICKKCSHVYVFDTETYPETTSFTDCPKCGAANSKKEFNELIKTDFFTKLIKKHGTKKTTRHVQSLDQSRK